MRLESFFPFAIVKRVVCVEPVARPVNRQVRNLREFRGLNEELLLGDKGRNEIDFVLVQMELSPIKVPIHVGISQEDLLFSFQQLLHQSHNLLFPPQPLLPQMEVEKLM